MAKAFAIRLITPAGKLLDGQATYANVPAHDGLIGFMADRAPIVMKLGMGNLAIDFAQDSKNMGGGSRTYLIEDGFAQMMGNRLTILTTKAWAADELVERDAEAELKDAKSAKDRSRASAKLALARASKGRGV